MTRRCSTSYSLGAVTQQQQHRFAYRIMETVSVFVCLWIIAGVVVTANLAELRVESPISVNKVHRVVNELTEFQEFAQLLTKDYNCDHLGRTREQRIARALVDTRFDLMCMSFKFMSRSAVYVAQVLREYFELAVDLVENEFVTARQKRETLQRSLDEPEHCMLTAFYDWGTLKGDLFKADLLLESLVFVESIDPQAASPLGDLGFQLRAYAHRYESVLKRQGFERRQRRPFAGPPPTDSGSGVDKYREAFSGMAKTIRDFSRAFCSGWTSFVRRDILRAETQNARDQSPFVRHTLQHEICEISFMRVHVVQNQVAEFADYSQIQEENQQNRIISWECDTILVLRRAYKPSGRNLPNPEFKGKQKFSLAALKDGLKSNSYWVNVVKYHNIVADVVLLVSIKEGDKMLRGIKMAVARKCAENCTVKSHADKTSEMKSALDEFKSVLDSLVALILDKRRINVGDNPQKQRFDERVGLVTEVLSDAQNVWTADEVDQVERICSEIPIKLERINGEVYVDDALVFESFFFTESILNVRELYHFVAKDF